MRLVDEAGGPLRDRLPFHRIGHVDPGVVEISIGECYLLPCTDSPLARGGRRQDPVVAVESCLEQQGVMGPYGSANG